MDIGFILESGYFSFAFVSKTSLLLNTAYIGTFICLVI